MKQFLLAIALIAVPLTAFAAFQVYYPGADAGVSAPAGLGDLSSFASLVDDVQALADQGDLAAAKTRIRDFEIAWDEAEKALKPIDAAAWHAIDGAADGAFRALRASTPDAATVSQTLAALRATLDNPTPATN